jgi:hypothetical protein
MKRENGKKEGRGRKGDAGDPQCPCAPAVSLSTKDILDIVLQTPATLCLEELLV